MPTALRGRIQIEKAGVSDPLDLSLKFGEHPILFEKSNPVAQNISQKGGKEGFDRLMGGDVLFPSGSGNLGSEMSC
jgi:hypothetical protein